MPNTGELWRSSRTRLSALTKTHATTAFSVQVRPDDAYGLEHEGGAGKTECWYVAADEGAEIIYESQC